MNWNFVFVIVAWAHWVCKGAKAVERFLGKAFRFRGFSVL
jgi:hypothetical protein